MSGGGGIPTDGGGSSPMSAAMGALSNGAGGSAGGAASAALQNIPQWQKGLLGAVTGDSSYGKNAPLIHQLLMKGLSSGAAPPGAPPMQPPMASPAQAPLPQSPGIRPMGMPPQPMGAQGGQMSPQMLAQLAQAYPALFGR